MDKESRIHRWANTWSSGDSPERKPTLNDLQNYGRICGMVRRQVNPIAVSPTYLYRIRTNLERAVIYHNSIDTALKGDVFGASSKQGTSFRLGLESCQPSKLCAARCYAHDGRDVCPNAVVRGALNSLLAKRYTTLPSLRVTIERNLQPRVRLAVKHALQEAWRSKVLHGHNRLPRIRFSHVGDIAAYPDFANAVVDMVHHEARLQDCSRIICVTYTRRASASKLDPNLWRVVISSDASSPGPTVPVGFPVYAAFDGKGQSGMLNFAEHHGASRVPVAGNLHVCPSTLPKHPHSCDENKCSVCYGG